MFDFTHKNFSLFMSTDIEYITLVEFSNGDMHMDPVCARDILSSNYTTICNEWYCVDKFLFIINLSSISIIIFSCTVLTFK